MRLWLYGLATAIASISALLLAITPAPSQKLLARAGGAAQLTAMLQGGSYNAVNCHNVRTFCRADVSRCDSNERERQTWRTQCLARHKTRYDECVSTKAPLRGHYGAKVRGPDPRCAHLANYRETKCQVEPQICPTYGQCEQKYGQCIYDQSAALDQQQNSRDDGAYVPEPPPAPTARPIPQQPEPDTRYRVYVKNGCRKYIEIAYFYEESPGQWAKSGWRGFQPGRVGELKSPIMTRRLGVFSTLGFPEQKFRRGFNMKKSVIDRNFLVPINEQLRGKGARTVPFDMLEWASDISKPLIVIEDCDQYKAGVRIKSVQTRETAAEPRPVLLQVSPAPKPEQPKVSAVEREPEPPRKPMQPAACQKIDPATMSAADIDRYKALAARGMIKLCEAG